MSNPTLKITPIAAFQQRVLSFPARNLPWRQTQDPYAILVSEIMLQQTQVDRVIPFYHRWLQSWPTIHSLARAPLPAVLAAWQGLGYNKRALHLHQCAKIISEKYAGDVLAALHSKLPGIGPYTIRAIQIFSANADLATVDTNIRRILIHEFRLPESVSDKELFSLAQSLVPKGRSRDWHNALMDYGAQFLTSRKTGIRPKTTQSKFEGSDRQLRAKILREALRKPLSLVQLSAFEPNPVRLKKALASLERDHLLVRVAGRYTVR